MEKAVIKGFIPADIPIIQKVDDLRAWHIPPMVEWKSFSVAAPSGPNADLRARFDKILPTFVKLQTGRSKRGPRPPKDRTVAEWLMREERDALIRQNVDLLARMAEQATALRIERTYVESLRVKVAELTRTLKSISKIKTL